MSRYLEVAGGPVAVKKLSLTQMGELADEIRHEMITVLSRNGGHLGPNLGVVELTLALHAVFDTPKDKFVWDVSHQVYVHKLLTGRKGRFNTIRSTGGLSGFAMRSESEHDCYGAAHAGTALSAALGICAADVTLPVVPMFHVNAWGVPYATAMTGSKLVLPGPGLDPVSLLELIQTEKATNLLGVPTVWMALLNHARTNGIKMSSVRKVVIGGSACPPYMIEAWEKEHGARVIHAWGMTEMSPVGTTGVLLPQHEALPEAERLEVKRKQGRPVFGVDLRLVDDDGAVIAHDGKTSGHLQVRGPWVAGSYYKRERDEAHQDGWFYTGDIGTIDQDSYLQITDRSKDVIKSGGEWVSSIDLENAAMSHPSVQHAAAIGLPHPKWLERPLLIVVKAPGKDISPAELRKFLETKLIKWWLPDAIEFIEALPLGATGKVLKRELRTKFADYKLPDSATPPN